VLRLGGKGKKDESLADYTISGRGGKKCALHRIKAPSGARMKPGRGGCPVSQGDCGRRTGSNPIREGTNSFRGEEKIFLLLFNSKKEKGKGESAPVEGQRKKRGGKGRAHLSQSADEKRESACPCTWERGAHHLDKKRGKKPG